MTADPQGVPALFDVPTPIEGGWASDATYSPCKRYRYTLSRTWGAAPEDGGRHLPFLMLNPSTATEYALDPTLRRCKFFAEREGYDGMVVLNLFAFRATDPRVMKAQDDPVGPGNDAAILDAASRSDLVVAAWGAHGTHRGRAAHVVQLLQGATLVRLGAPTKDGHPRHPLYLKGTTALVPHP